MWISCRLSRTTFDTERSQIHLRKNAVNNIDRHGQLDSKGIDFVIKSKDTCECAFKND